MEIPVSLLEDNIRRGTILHSTFFEEIGHGKFFAVMGISQDSVAGFFFINSNIHPAIFGKPEQLALQYPLKKEHYGFLKYDSFLCATNIVTCSRNRLAESILCGKTSVKGDLREQDLSQILSLVRQSGLFSNIEKLSYFY